MHTHRTLRIVTGLALGITLALGAGCKGKPGADKSGKAKPAKPAKMVVHELAPAGDKWKGFSARGPDKGCKVMQDGVASARIGCDGPGIGDSSGRNGFDIVFTQKKEDLGKFKARWQGIWKKRPKTQHKVLADKPDLFAWKATTGKHAAYHFMMQLKVGGQDVTCSTNLMRGGGTKDEHEAHLAACRSLAKK